MATRVEAATPRALDQGMALFEGRARSNLSRYSHQRGTPTPSPPGQPPALISGRLRSSFQSTAPVQAGAGMWSAVVGPTTVYARIQEEGGMAGRGHRSRIPKRPYLRPAADDLLRDTALIAVFERSWGTALRI
ncbi:hypothetical protein BG418_18710 [Streptomyces sp. CBMA152]|nr:hypothetical protein [Streptomyces sp. CBMA152]MBD0743606.1 hypothetical protein [Streptomyces sp. CBMA152]